MEILPINPMPELEKLKPKHDALMSAAIAMEANFLTEMLKFGGHGESRNSFGGGEGEDAFSGLLAREQATLMAESGGIGLAEQIVESLMRREQNV